MQYGPALHRLGRGLVAVRAATATLAVARPARFVRSRPVRTRPLLGRLSVELDSQSVGGAAYYVGVPTASPPLLLHRAGDL